MSERIQPLFYKLTHKKTGAIYYIKGHQNIADFLGTTERTIHSHARDRKSMHGYYLEPILEENITMIDEIGMLEAEIKLLEEQKLINNDLE